MLIYYDTYTQYASYKTTLNNSQIVLYQTDDASELK